MSAVLDTVAALLADEVRVPEAAVDLVHAAIPSVRVGASTVPGEVLYLRAGVVVGRQVNVDFSEAIAANRDMRTMIDAIRSLAAEARAKGATSSDLQGAIKEQKK